jgi:hypothetical protein
MRARLRSEEGAVLVIVGILLFAVIGATAVAIDGGRGFIERSNVQNAADHAALAAAKKECDGATLTAAADAGRASAARNGYTGLQVEVSKNAEGWDAKITSTIEAPFGKAIGRDSLTAVGSAVASCSPGSPGTPLPAIHAQGTCAQSIDWSGSTNKVTGAIHSNADIHIGGSNNTVTGPGSYVTSYNNEPSKNNVWTEPDKDNPRPVAARSWPAPYSDYAANLAGFGPHGAYSADARDDGEFYTPATAGSKIDMGWLKDNGHYSDSTKKLKPGIYFTTGEIAISDSGVTGQVTLVGGGRVTISGSDHKLTPYYEGLLAYSNFNGGCSTAGLMMGGSGHSWTGTLFAPRSILEMSGSTNTALTGSLLGLKVRINGSNLTIKASDAVLPTEKSVSLIR